MKKDDRAHGFVVLDTEPFEDYGATGIWLRHERTGLEVVHLLNDDEENLFAFAFCTPATDSTGVAHVLEHSVLCGSQRYPLKDPFIRLENQSVNTYLNAYTAADHTVFPASSIVRADYFNLMSVYADAVFFPLLRPEIFLQECHRVEFDPDGKPGIQGVVYNEMKGNYSSFDSVASDAIERAVLAGTQYVHDSGGDPMDIPSLTLRKLRAFHRKYYCPANCLVFLYGNIPTEEQLAFLDAEVLARIPSGGHRARWPQKKDVPVRPTVKAYGPAENASAEDGAARATVSLAWRADFPAGGSRARQALEILFLGELLWGDDCAPVTKALLGSGLGEDIAPQSGESISMRWPVLNCGLRGVRVQDARKVGLLILRTLTDLHRDGVAPEDVERTCMAFDFSNREVRRFDGPYSLVLLRRCLRSWRFGESPWRALHFRETFAELAHDIAADPGFVQDMIARYLLHNQNRSLVTVVPSAAWSKKRAREEAALVRQKLAERPERFYRAQLEAMHAFQDMPVGEHENDLIPRLRRDQLDCSPAPLRTVVSELCGIPLFVNKEPTNGIVYVDVACAADTLRPEDYLLLPALTECLTQVGWGGLSWDAALTKAQTLTGGFGAYTRTAHVPECVQGVAEKKDYVGRDWVVFHFKALEEKTAEAFALLAECLSLVDFSDTARLSDLLKAQYNAACSLVVPHAHWYAAYRASCTANRNLAINEIWEGLTALFTARALASRSAKKVAGQFRELLRRLLCGGSVLHVTGTAKGIAAAKREFPALIGRLSLTAPKERRPATDDEFYALTRIAGERTRAGSFPVDELFVIPGTVGFAGFTFRSAPFGTKDSIADDVFTHLLSTTELWKQIRTVGGAYGVFLSANSDSSLSRFVTYRDPKPFGSLAVMQKAVQDLRTHVFSETEVEKAVTGCYSDEVAPHTPSGRGATAFLWELYALTNRQKAQRIKWLLSITPKDVQRAAERYARECTEGKTVIICGKQMISARQKESAGAVINLPI